MRTILTALFMTLATQIVGGEAERREFEEKFIPYTRCLSVYRIATNNYDIIRHINNEMPELIGVLEKNYQELFQKMPEMLLIQTELSQNETEFYYEQAKAGEEYLELHPLYGQLLEISLLKDMPMTTLMVTNCMYQFDLTYPDYD